MKRVLLEPENSDVVFCFVNEGNKMLYAHKGILIARCDAFKLMFNSGMKESNTNVINITTDSYTAYFHLLHHIYTGTAVLHDVNVDQLIETLQLADRYFMITLKQICERALKKHINSQNLTRLYEVALNSKANALKHFCIKAANRYDSLPALISSTYDLELKKKRK